jgi:tryptophanyl-tRNA synthetase
VEAQFQGGGYGDFKKSLAELTVDTFAPVRERTQAILADEPALDKVLAHGAHGARKVAAQTMTAVRDLIGFIS